MTIRTCFFDMGNVLLYFSHELMCQNIAQLIGLPAADVRRLLLVEGWLWRLERGEITEQHLQVELARNTGSEIDLTALRFATADIFRLNESIVPVLHRLKRQGLRLVLLSNTSITHLRFIEERFSVLELMDDRVTSFEARAMKPEDQIFQAALERAGCEPQECFYTDDIPAYVKKAESLGIHAHLYTNTDALLQSLQSLGVLP